ncbi:DUF2802 domain-containing protein [Amphritea sp. 2_MG-2023]|uniref:DUF2802 domain-containing protein n=1 Tax=Amphritea TaxID=515417 RepID=UPI001C06B178|nr:MULTISPECIES: DUF2802 domain-containing protein [Amphritea]MBU2964795.1 DUF2802 domain-containing protein [Amphritea atlantica]MDO6419629.1 DUF2802 domain-containing protein [Amphritea sp. 2_MG-2023]MDX2422827.1 DUF2802 domain-containing protein [Amphritea sp.]
MIWLALAVVAVIASVSVGYTIHAQRQLQQHQRQYEALINVLRNEIQALTSSSIGMGHRLMDVENQLNITAEKQQELANRDPGVLAYNQAARLMEMGADVDDLVKNCGIGRPEAELMALLHKEIAAPDKQS